MDYILVFLTSVLTYNFLGIKGTIGMIIGMITVAIALWYTDKPLV